MSEEKNIKGFNYGYQLAKLNPKLATSISNSTQSSKIEALSYFKEGIKQYHREKLISQRKEQQQSKTKDLDKDRSY